MDPSESSWYSHVLPCIATTPVCQRRPTHTHTQVLRFVPFPRRANYKRRPYQAEGRHRLNPPQLRLHESASADHHGAAHGLGVQPVLTGQRLEPRVLVVRHLKPRGNLWARTTNNWWGEGYSLKDSGNVLVVAAEVATKWALAMSPRLTALSR
jgi:hypothetical protein